MQKGLICIIPARGGSTGIPNKNIKDFCGKPLIAHTILAAKESGIFERIIVSTDSEEIAKISREFGAEVPYLRPIELATATASVADAVLHLLHYLKEKDSYESNTFFLLQPTSPLRDAGDIQKSLEAFRANNAPGLVSVCLTHHQTLNIVDGALKVLSRGVTEHINRQELLQTYKQDGSMIYIQDTAHFLAHPSFDAEGMTPYVVPKWKAVDIDDPEDFILAVVLYKNRGSLQ